VFSGRQRHLRHVAGRRGRGRRRRHDLDLRRHQRRRSGDLQGSIAATIKGQDSEGNYLVQHYWVTSAGETILLKQAVLKPVATSDPNVVAVLWGNYSSDILGGTGKFANATGKIDYFGIADFKERTWCCDTGGSATE
jgi:hypothetical protein